MFVPNTLTQATLPIRGTQLGETVDQECSELDEVLVRLLELHSIRWKFVYIVPRGEGGTEMGCWVESWLPQAAARGMVDLVEKRGRR